MTLALFDSYRRNIRLVVPPGLLAPGVDAPPLTLVHVERWLDSKAADALYRTLLELSWNQEEIDTPAGRVPLPRLTLWWGDRAYTYAGVLNRPSPWPQRLAALRVAVSTEVKCAFDSCLGNYYRTGSDHIGFHADKEKDLEYGSPIASVSLGGARRFLLRPRTRSGAGPEPARTPDLPTIEVKLEHGDLLIMPPGCQQRWVHSVPKQAISEPRISLTWRRTAGAASVKA